MSSRSRSKHDLKAIGLRIRELRGDIRQEDLAKELGLSQGQLSKIERGRFAPTLEVILAVANRFGKSLDWIVRGPE
jgi:transcriptional regulator with XRE-family HTH domain